MIRAKSALMDTAKFGEEAELLPVALGIISFKMQI